MNIILSISPTDPMKRSNGPNVSVNMLLRDNKRMMMEFNKIKKRNAALEKLNEEILQKLKLKTYDCKRMEKLLIQERSLNSYLLKSRSIPKLHNYRYLKIGKVKSRSYIEVPNNKVTFR